jgi:hypothetical protein
LEITPSHQRFSAASGNIAAGLTVHNVTVVLRQSHIGRSVSVRFFEQPKTCLTLGE